MLEWPRKQQRNGSRFAALRYKFMKRRLYSRSITGRDTDRGGWPPILFLSQALAFCVAACFFTACHAARPKMDHAEKTTPAAVLHYIPKDLLNSAAFTNAVGAPPTNAAILQADKQGLKDARKGVVVGGTQYARANDQEHLTINVVNGVLGPWFQVKNFPMTSNLLQKAFDDTWIVAHRAKDLHFRHRPDPMLPTSSYPSAHSTEGVVLTTILEWLDPKCEAQVGALNEEIGRNRVLLQRHYPSDVQAGRHLGAWVVDQLHQSKQFSDDVAAAQRELTPYVNTNKANSAAAN